MKRSLLLPFDALYAAALRAKNAYYDHTALEQLQWPVISVGNLSVGGSGKTPLVILLAELLAKAGWEADVLSRGYGRSSRAAERVNRAGSVERFGDEPLLIAQSLPAPVFVAAHRYDAGRLAERTLPAGLRVHLLDDGFQHRRLARAADIVAVHRSDLAGRLLPAGRLREPLRALQRADIIVLRAEDAELQPRLLPYLRSGVPFWTVERSLSIVDIAAVIERPALAFCAIAHPDEFFTMLEAKGIELAAKLPFRDHHRYSPAEIEEIAFRGARLNCGTFLTTEKDAVKLDARLRARISQTAPLRVAALSLALSEPGRAVADLLALLKKAADEAENRLSC